MADDKQKNTPGTIARSKEKAYRFKQVYSDETTEQIFSESIQDEVDNALDGSNSCVFAFGATGSGKTYTMFGGSKGSESERGVIELSIRVVQLDVVHVQANGEGPCLQLHDSSILLRDLQ